MQVTKSEIQEAKKKSLYEYMLQNHPNMVTLQGSSIRMKDNHSISITKNFYSDFATCEKGDNISFLMKHLHLSFQESVLALNGCSGTTFEVQGRGSDFTIPTKATNNNRIISYLTTERMLDKKLINWLISKNVLYQDAYKCNAVFVNPTKSFYEVRGIYGDFHRNQDSSPNNINYWYVSNPKAKVLRKVYITESSIDAISLMMLRPDEAYYISIAGAANQQRIDAIKDFGLETILATDNDSAGDLCRQRNRDIKHIKPISKDWNSDLIQQHTERK